MIVKKKGLPLACVTVLSCVISSQAISGDMGAVGISEQTPGYRALITLTAGPDFVSPGQSQTLALQPPFQNTYTKGNSTQAVADGGLFVGLERKLNDKVLVQLGVSGYGDAQMTPKGTVWQFRSPEFEDLSYAYHISHGRVMATTKLLTTISSYQALHPYVSGEIGAGFNNTRGYQETPLEAGVLPTAPFIGHNQTSFAWGVGAGLDYDLSQHIRVGAGYQFSDLGSASLGPTPASLTNQTLSLSHMYANQLRFQLTILV